MKPLLFRDNFLFKRKRTIHGAQLVETNWKRERERRREGRDRGREGRGRGREGERERVGRQRKGGERDKKIIIIINQSINK